MYPLLPRSVLKGRGEPCKPGERADITGCIPAPKRPRAPLAPGAKPRRPRNVDPGGYDEVVPRLPNRREPLYPLGKDWVPAMHSLYHLRDVLADPENQPAWDKEPTGWGRLLLDTDKFLKDYGPGGTQPLKVQDLLDRGWVSRSQLVGGGQPPRDQYAITLSGKLAQEANLRGMYEVKAPTKQTDIPPLVSFLEAQMRGVDDGKEALAYFGVSLPFWKKYEAQNQPLSREKVIRKLLDEMLYRKYNPISPWERAKRSPEIQEKLKRLAGGTDQDIAYLQAILPVSQQIKALQKQSEECFQNAHRVQAQLFPNDYPKVPRPEGEERDRLQKELDDWGNKAQAIGNQLAPLYEQRGRLMREYQAKNVGAVLAVPGAVPVTVEKFDPAHTPAEKEAVESAAMWLGGKVAQGKGANAAMLPAYKVLHDDTDNLGRGGPSAYYQPAQHAINVHTGMVSTSTNVHEMAHGIEYQMPGAQEAAQRFRAHRVGKEEEVFLKSVLPTYGYGQWEMGAKDQFDKMFGGNGYYVGKKVLNNGGTEIVSMGVQQLYDDASRFARDDPEYCGFILGILDGTTRDVPVPF